MRSDWELGGSRKAWIEEDYVVAAALAREVKLVESRLGRGNQSAYTADILKHCQGARQCPLLALPHVRLSFSLSLYFIKHEQLC